MKKTLLIILGVILLLCVLATGGLGVGYAYLYQQRSNYALSYNQKLFEKLDNLKTISFTSDDNNKVKFVTGVARFDDLLSSSQTTDNTLKKKYEFDNDKVLEYSVNVAGTTDLSTVSPVSHTKGELKQTDLFFMIFSQTDEWNKVIKDKKYTVSEVEESGKKLWRYDLEKNSVNNIFIEGLKKSIIQEYTSSGKTLGENAIVTDLKGNAHLILDIDQKTKDLVKLEYSLDDDLTLTFGDELSQDFAGIFSVNEGEKLNIKFVLQKGYKQSTKLEEVKYKDDVKKFQSLSQWEQLVLAI